MSAKIRVDGIDNTIKDILKYTNKFEDGAKKIIDDTAKEVRKIARQKAPYLTGKTRQSISVKTIKGGLGKTVSPKRERGGHGYIAHFHEYGTTKMAAHPFMTPAEEQAKGNFYKKIEELVGEENIV